MMRVFLSLGKPPGDDVLLGDLQLKPTTKIMMMGTPEEKLVRIDRGSFLCKVMCTSGHNMHNFSKYFL